MERFIITEEEKSRILNLHKKRTKNNYLVEGDPGDLTQDDFSQYENDPSIYEYELTEADPGDLTPDLIGPENEADLATTSSNTNQENITESLGAAPSALVSTYEKYNGMGSEGTFNEIFKTLREKGVEPYSSFYNGCATKVSLALQAAGKNVPPGYRVQDGPMKGKTIQTSARGLSEKLGKPDVIVNGEITADELAKKFGNDKTGVLICSPCGFGPNVSGHATVFSNGNTVDGTGYHLNNPNAVIKMWYT